MKHSFVRPLVVLGTAALIGGGCQSPSPMDTYSSTSGSSAELVQEEGVAVPPQEPGKTSTPSSTTQSPSSDTPVPTTNMNTEKLAFPGILPDAEMTKKQIRIKTDKGDIVFELLPKEGPKAASNFVYLTKKGFYDGLIFHRVEPGFVIQGGDPLGQGYGGPGYQFEDDPVKLPYKKGIVAMANAGPNTNGSQFFIMLGDVPLPPNYSIFGRVLSGQEIVDKIQVGDVMRSVAIENRK